MTISCVTYLVCIIAISGVWCLGVAEPGPRGGIRSLNSHLDYRKNNFKDRNREPRLGACSAPYPRPSRLRSRVRALSYVSTTLRGINLGYRTATADSPESVMIVDGTGLAYRCFFAMPDIRSARGTDIGCLMGFMNSLARLHRMFSPKYVGLVFDSPGANDEKRDIWPEYKLNRQLVAPSFRNQLGWIREFCAILGLPVFIERSTEADDIITSMINFLRELSRENARRLDLEARLPEVEFQRGTARGIFDRFSQRFGAARSDCAQDQASPGLGEGPGALPETGAEGLGYDVTVVTADKDLLQILSQNGSSKVTVRIVQPHKSYRVVNQHTVRQEYGIDPERFSEYLALVGDSADNIPGIMGVGPKTAPKLIAKYKSFDDILTSEEIGKLCRKGGKYSESVKMAHEFHSIVKLKRNLRVLTSIDQLTKSSALSCQLARFLKMFSLQKAASRWSMFTKG